MTENDIKDRIDTIYGKSPDPRSAVAAEKYGFTQGVVWLNKLQPYTAKDMEDFAEWIKINCWTYYPNSKIWKRDGFTFNKAITAQLRELWEKERERNDSNKNYKMETMV